MLKAHPDLNSRASRDRHRPPGAVPLPGRPFTRVMGVAMAVAALVAVLAPVLPGALAPSRAEAHAALVGSSPERGAQLIKPPQRVELTFSEPVEAEFSQLTLTREGGDSVALGPLEADGPTLRAEVRETLSAGQYVVHYRVLSQDGHPVAGDVPFTVTAVAPSPANGADQEQTQPAPNRDELASPAPRDRGQAEDRGSAQGWLWVAAAAVVAVIGAGLASWRSRSRR